MCFDFTNMAPKIKVQTFFSFGGHVFILFFSGKLGEIWASSTIVLELCYDLKKFTQHEKKCSDFFWRSFTLEFFSGKLREIWAKILHTPKNLHAPTPMVRVPRF